MTKLLKTSAIALLAMLTLAPLASAQQNRRVIIIHRRPVVVYDPFYWDRWGPGYYGSTFYRPTTGDVTLKTNMKQATVFVDGGFVGRVDKNKRLTLPPGVHNVELRDVEGRVIFSQSVQVQLGKPTKLDLRNSVG